LHHTFSLKRLNSCCLKYNVCVSSISYQ
jgi:hypothetical protein